mmetsp:Transcript_521/g.1259  ORF Transcript_521/g.1259 Transcript_521/m.1259 type:complete len:317 (+) Transcript_521:2-952(+)
MVIGRGGKGLGAAAVSAVSAVALAGALLVLLAAARPAPLRMLVRVPRQGTRDRVSFPAARTILERKATTRRPLIARCRERPQFTREEREAAAALRRQMMSGGVEGAGEATAPVSGRGLLSGAEGKAVNDQAEEAPPEKATRELSDDEWSRMVSEKKAALKKKKESANFSAKQAAPVETSWKIGRKRGIYDGIDALTAKDMQDFMATLQGVNAGGGRNLLIDVREKDETAAPGSMLLGAVNVPLSEFEEALQMAPEDFYERYKLDWLRPEDVVVLHCQSSVRAGRAAMMLSKANLVSQVRMLGENLLLCDDLARDER